MTPYLQAPGVLAMAHRGFSLDGLENSMAAFASAVDLGFSYVETDVHATADGELIAFHDDTLDRTTDGHGAVAQLPWAVVREARIGGVEPIPRLIDLLERWPDLKVNIDIKAPGAVAPLVDIIERTRNHDRVCVTSFSDRRRRAALAALSRPVCTSAGQQVMTEVVLGQWAPAVVRRVTRGIDCVQVPERHGPIPIVTAAFVRRMHSVGVQVHVWTVDEPADMHRLLDLGVDGVITDRSDLLRDVLIERGSWPRR